MSDRMDWIIPSGFDNPVWIIPTVVWTTGAMFQFVSAAREWWTNREDRERRRQSEASDWTKVRRGEMKRGYRLWLEPKCCPYSQILCHSPVFALLMNDDDRNGCKEDLSSVFKVVKHRMPDDAVRYAKVLRQYSIFSPNVYTDIARVVYQYHPIESGWKHMKDYQLDDRTVAMLFKRRSSSQICAVLVDVNKKTSQLLEIWSPMGIHDIEPDVLFMCRDEERKNRLRIVYILEAEDVQEIISVDYEIRSSDVDPSRLIASEVGNQSITIPGHREYRLFALGNTYILRSTGPPSVPYMLAFDHRGDYKIEPYDDWLRDFKASILGQQLFKAFDDFVSLSPEIMTQRGRLQCCLLRDEILQVYCSNTIPPAWSIAQRHFKVPSLKFLAAGVICRARPTGDLSTIKTKTGIDIFDGIYENREKPMPTIRLLPAD